MNDLLVHAELGGVLPAILARRWPSGSWMSNRIAMWVFRRTPRPPTPVVVVIQVQKARPLGKGGLRLLPLLPDALRRFAIDRDRRQRRIAGEVVADIQPVQPSKIPCRSFRSTTFLKTARLARISPKNPTCYDSSLSGLGLRATDGCKPRQVRKEATVVVRFVCRGLPGAWHMPAPCIK
jgi:hypothetical protein